MKKIQWPVLVAVIALFALLAYSRVSPGIGNSRYPSHPKQPFTEKTLNTEHVRNDAGGLSENIVPLAAFSQDQATVDMQVITINTPVSGNNLSASETVSITLKNQGTQPVKSLKVAFQIDQSIPVVETVTQMIDPGSTLLYSFATRANLSVPGSYAFKAFCMVNKDAVPANDTAFKTVVNLKL
ncbi:MAG TPA: hypothetical protein P5228_02910 [Bacteroidales bacterium]|nr:hypothetical protein [Bacteroidales bacterium]HRZ49261.1 hypothetical protein [Bacteroidales bacterium]